MSDLEQVSTGTLWLVATGSSIALAAAVLTWPGTRRRRETGRRVALVGLRLLVGIVSAFGREARHAQVRPSGDDGEATALFMFSVVMLTLAVLRVIYARYLERVTERARSGTPAETPTTTQGVIFLVTLLVVFAAVTASLALCQ